MRVRADPIARDGRGPCAKILPELITSTTGLPHIRDGARDAVRVCPKLTSGSKADRMIHEYSQVA